MRRVALAQWWLLLSLLLCMSPVQARSHHARGAELPTIAVAALPPEARETLQLIKQGGPFPNARDDIVFGNYEHSLPQLKRTPYHEFTVKTPGARNRGARRIVCGAVTECYYTADHYRNFYRISDR